MNNNILDAYNVVNGITSEAFSTYIDEVTESIDIMHTKIDHLITDLSTELTKCLCDILKLNEDNDKHVYVEPTYDSILGNGISISWIGSANEEKVYTFAKVFKNIQTLNFMDYYQRFNNYKYIKESIEKFTNNFKEQMISIASSGDDNEVKYYKLDKRIFEKLSLNTYNYDLLVSRQEIKQPIETLKDSIENASIFVNNPEKFELFVKDNKNVNLPIVVDKITFYYPLRKAL